MPVFYHPQEQTLAGQPQENPWTQQGTGYSQGAPGYGPAYGEQQAPPAPYPQQGQAHEQPGGYEQQPQPYQQTQVYEQGQVYEQQAYQQQPTAYDQPTVYDQQAYDPSVQQAQGQYEVPGQQVYGQPQSYPGQPQSQRGLPPGQAQGHPQQPGWEHWRLPQKQAQGLGKPARTERGFVGSLFDFGFTSFVTPKIIKVLYILVTIWTILWALAFLRLGFRYGGTAGGLATLIIVDPILVLVSLGVFRVVLEFFMVTFRMQEDLRSLRERAAESSGQTAGAAESGGDGSSSAGGA
jgi:uncharacterized membrane protein